MRTKPRTRATVRTKGPQPLDFHKIPLDSPARLA